MICLHYDDERELAEALHSIARRCQAIGARLFFLASEAACEKARKAVRNVCPSAQPGLTFRPLDYPRNGRGADVWNATIEVVRSALLDASVVGCPMSAWIESPVPPEGTFLRPALHAYYHSLDTTPVSSSVICAHRLSDLPEGARASLLEYFDIVMNAKMLLPQCPSWLINRAKVPDNDVLTPAVGIPAAPTDSDRRVTTLVQAEKLATLGQLAAALAHELGTPLSIISSSIQYLHERLAAANDPASEFTMTVLQNVERMDGLLRSMRDLAAARKPRLEPTDLKEAVSEILRFTSAEFARRGITVDVSFDPSLPPAWLDPLGVKQVLLNLIKNALEALLQGGDAIRVRTRLRAEDRLAVVEIEDNGPAIPADVLPNLFRPFHTTKEGGTGLGLYLSRQIARDHGGDLEVGNLPRGVRFTLSLPLEQRGGDDHGARADRRRRT
jgi:signal transduction histidine kinase